MPIEIRELRPEDHDDAGRVTASAWQEFQWDGHPGFDDFVAEVADVGARAGRTLVLGAFEDGRPLGTVTLEIDRRIREDGDPLPPDVANVRMLGVAPDVRRRGVGRSLMEAAISEARARGKRAVTLTYDPVDPAPRSLYASLGFVDTGETDGHEVVAILAL
jgi:GNAT superfamily N-acetyltransferase